MKRAFWDRENEANRTRKKPLDGLAYLSVPKDLLPQDAFDASFPAREAALRIRHLEETGAKIVNLTGYTNTDLKLEYGVANLNALSEYDTHYTMLATALQECGQALFDLGRFDEALRVLEFEAQTGSDISACYRLLIDLYQNRLFLQQDKAQEKIRALLPVANNLRSLSRDGIVAMLEQALPPAI